MRLHFAFHQLPHLSVAEAQTYWLTRHGPLVRSHSAARGLIAYNQVHRFDTPLTAGFASARGVAIEPYIGHAESWFDRSIMQDGPERHAASAAAVADERNFIDWSRSTIFIGKELLFVDRDWA